MKLSKLFASVSALILIAGATATSAQEVQTIEQYLDSLNYGKVSFEGRVQYDRREDSLRLSLPSGWFRAVSDAGREVREQLQEQCETTGLFDDAWCQIQGEGTIEIRGSDIWISIDKVNYLE